MRGPALLLIAQLYRVGKHARLLAPEDRLRLRQLQSRPILDKLSNYLLAIQAEVLPKSPEGRAVRYTLKNSTALTRYCADGDLEIDNNATERAIRGAAVGRHNLGVLWQRPGRQNGRSATQLRGLLSAGRSRSVYLAQGRSLPHCRSAHHPARRTSTAQLSSPGRLSQTRDGVADIPHPLRFCHLDDGGALAHRLPRNETPAWMHISSSPEEVRHSRTNYEPDVISTIPSTSHSLFSRSG